jgi:hypothetical protein
MLDTAKADALNKWLQPRIDAALAKKQVQDEHLRERAEAEEQQAVHLYTDCLFAKTEALAVASTEPAQTIVQAAVGACGESRQAIANKAIRAGRDPTYDTNDVEKIIIPKLTLDVISTRARQTPPPAPAPNANPHETPI